MGLLSLLHWKWRDMQCRWISIRYTITQPLVIGILVQLVLYTYIYAVPVACTQIVAYSNVCNVTVVRTDTKQPSKPFHL